MPLRTRPHRSLPALLLVAALIGAGSPAAAATPVGDVALRAPDRDPGASTPVVWVTPPPTASVTAPVPGADPGSTASWSSRATPDVPEPKPRTQVKGEAGDDAAGRYRGRNRVWIPALGIDRSVSFFSCSSSAYPGDRVYRWGCAGGNNVYLFGHAHSVFKPLHDAYVRGRLRKGMKVYFADGRGRVATYAVRWWRVTTPDRGGFAYAAQSRPSLTLQTCVGKKSQYRLIVRLVKVG